MLCCYTTDTVLGVFAKGGTLHNKTATSLGDAQFPVSW